MKKHGKSYLISMAKALIILRGKTVEELSCETGIPHKNLRSFLGGVGMALSPEHAVKFFYALGIGARSNGSTGLLSHCVHNLTVHDRDIKLLSYLQPLLPAAQVVALPFSRKGAFPFLLRSGEIRVLLLVKAALLHRRPRLDRMWFIDGAKDTTYKGAAIPAEYIDMIFSRQLGMLDFDALSHGVFPDWTLIRQIANSHGITYTEIRNFLMRHSQQMRSISEEKSDPDEVVRDFSLVYGRDHVRDEQDEQMEAAAHG